MFPNKLLKICATIEARMGSSRLPNKVLLPLSGKPMLYQLIKRIQQSKYIDEIIVATTEAEEDKQIIKVCEEAGCLAYAGSVDNIVDRLLKASEVVKADIIVQLTGDNPLVDAYLIDSTLELYFSKPCDYASNNLQQTFPLGFDVKIFSRDVLLKVSKLTTDPTDLVHGSYFIYRNPTLFKLENLIASPEYYWPDLRVTVDEPNDYELVRKIYDELYAQNNIFSSLAVINFLKENKHLVALNSNVIQKRAMEG